VPFADLETTVVLGRNIDAACEAIDRDPATVLRSACQVVCVADDPEVLTRRSAAIGRDLDEDLRVNGIAGTVTEAAERVQEFAAAGIERLYLQVLDLSDLDHLDELSTIGPNEPRTDAGPDAK
jgi:alkanesulfonate monooxygenase SsuD/methylene tetrahydromethanopterin reductase-like flavin-dependent oxidoreductase (luciferase family)